MMEILKQCLTEEGLAGKKWTQRKLEVLEMLTALENETWKAKGAVEDTGGMQKGSVRESAKLSDYVVTG